jgi:hypothetical protein
MILPPENAHSGYRRPGEVVALRWVRNDPADVVMPVRVVEDTQQRTILFLAEGSPMKVRADADGNRLGRVRPVKERERRIAKLVDARWNRNHALMIHEPERFGAVWLFWLAEDWTFNNYYVNLQAPLMPSLAGFDTEDYLLDIVAQQDLSWEWKDEDEFEEALETNLFPSELIDDVRAESRRFISEIEAGQWPFGQGLEAWRPDPDWDVPDLPKEWDTDLHFPKGRVESR